MQTTVNVTGFDNINASLRQIIQAINNLNTVLTDAFPAPLTGSATFDPASLLTLTQDIATLTVAGAALGNIVDVSFSLDALGITISGYVSTANTVKIVFFNGTSGTVNLASGIIRVKVYQ